MVNKFKKNITDNESDELMGEVISGDETNLQKIGIKRFDEIRLDNKNRASFKKNEKLPELIKDIEEYIGTKNYKYDKKELPNILKKYIPFFKDDMTKIDNDLYRYTRVYENHNKIVSTLIGLYKSCRETQSSLYYAVTNTKTGEKEDHTPGVIRNPELTYIFYLLMMEIMENNK